MLPVILGLAGALLAKGMTRTEVTKEVERKADLLDKAYYTTEDVAKIAGLSEYTVRKKIRDKELTAEGEGSRRGYRIKKVNLIEFLSKQRTFIRNYERAASTWTKDEIEAYISARRANMSKSRVAKMVEPPEGEFVSTAMAGTVLIGAVAGGVTAVVPSIVLLAALLFSGKKEVPKKEIDAMALLLVNARLLHQYINMKERLLEQLHMEEEEIRLSYGGKLESDEYKCAVILCKKKISDAEIEIDVLRSQLSKLEQSKRKKEQD
ncbi:MAG: helix-turn-helix domain-containing protein [Schwartzia sp. (in: firmicutes)]